MHQGQASGQRATGLVNTNMHLESFHRLLKVVYLQGKQNRRLDHLISIVLKVARDKGFERIKKMHKGNISHRASELNRRHQKAEEMIASGVNHAVKSTTSWEVQSLSNPLTIHVVQAEMDHECTCRLVCSVCKVCVYSYTCTCIDYVLHNTACKHIHFINTMANQSGVLMLDKTSELCGSTNGPTAISSDPISCPIAFSSNASSASTSAPVSVVLDAGLKQVLRTTASTIEIQRRAVVNKATELLELASTIDSVEGVHTAPQHLSSAINIMRVVKSQQVTHESHELPSSSRKRPAPNSNMEKKHV